MEFSQLIADHGNTVTFLGALIEGETILTLAGVAAHRGYLHLTTLIALAALGSFIGDQAYFLIGRLYGKRMFKRFKRLRAATRTADSLLLRYAGASVIAVRFIYGMRTLGPIAIGMSRMRWGTFIGFNAIGAVLWSACWLSVGYLLGEAGQMVFGKDLRRIEHWFFVGVAVAALLLGVYLHWRRRAAISRDTR